MNSSVVLNKKFESLPDYLKSEVNDFIDFLKQKTEKKNNQRAISNDISSFAGILSNKEADELSKIIKNGCEKIDNNEW
ncbi:MAG: DUF2281 domain-containing protein [Flavobacteriales bacterium]|nr:DUF2281 domain-containing protein [Flavobacteriales bacterium]